MLWTPWQRVEVFNCFRQAERVGLIEGGDAQRVIRLIEQEVRLGYWPHAEFSWTDAVRTACHLSETLGPEMPIRAMDLFHVAVAIEIAAEGFVSFDEDQVGLAKAAGMRTIRLAGKPAKGR